MFADDTKIFRQILSREDSRALQLDLNILQNWSDTWQLQFNSDKCHILTLGNFENIHHAYRYRMGEDELEHVDNQKDLGITIDAELSFDEHISRKARIANAIVGQIRRSFSHLDSNTFRRLYIAFVRPHLEYAHAIWSPYMRKHINILEGVQIRATKLVNGFGGLEYTERLKKLNLPTLVYRRKRGDMIEVYKHFKIYDRSILPRTFHPRERPSRQHNYQLFTPMSKDGKRGVMTNSFYHRIVKTWNDLPKKIVESRTINDFKNNIDDHWKNDGSKFDHRHQRLTDMNND